MVGWVTVAKALPVPVPVESFNLAGLVDRRTAKMSVKGRDV